MINPSSIRVGFDVERSVTGAFTGAWQLLGAALVYSPVIVIFDNQSTISIELSIDGVNTWKTFSSGEAIVLDLRANKGQAYNFSVPEGTQFRVRGTGGTDSFRMSTIYPE